MKSLSLAIAAFAVATVAAKAQNVQITEIMYTGMFGEFVEITNVSTTTAQNMSGWKFSDNSRGLSLASVATATDLSGIGGGSLAAGASAIITEVSSTIFIQAWYTEPGKTALPANRIVANNAINLGRSDEVNIYPAGAANGVTDIQDRITYNDQVSGPRSEDISVVPISNDTTLAWPNFQLSSVGTGAAWKAGVQGSINGRPITGPVGSPGVFPNL